MREGNFLEQPQQNQLETPGRAEFELNRKDIDRINEIGELDARFRQAERVAHMFASKEVVDEAKEDVDEWRQHKKEAVDFATEKIRQLPGVDGIMRFAVVDDLEIIDKYDKQTQELIDQGVGASLMTPEEKQAYYDALSRKNNFINILRDQYGIQQDAAREIYQTMAANSKTAESVNSGDANAIIDDWDQYMAKSESMPEEKLENLSVREIEEIEGELRGNQEVSEPVSESKKDFPFKWFKTEKDSIYAYDNDGKTSRFKTVESKQYERQDVTVFVDLTPEEEAKFLENIDLMSENKLVCVAEELSSNDGARIIKDISEVRDPDKIYLAIFNLDTKMWEMKKKASLKPIIGYAPFDTRMYEENGRPRVKAHLGHKIVEIEKAREPVAEPAAEPAKEESALESVSIPDETPAQNAETREMKVEQEVVAESAKEERKTENAPTLMEKPIESNEKREMGEIVINKEKILDFIDVGRKLAHAFRERDKERLNPLIEERYISSLVASFDNLHILLRDDKQTVNGEELGRAITRIANTIQNIGNVSRGQSMRDNVESLGKVVFYLEGVGDRAHDFGVFLSRKKENKPEEILQALRGLENTIKYKRDFVASKRNALSQYQK